MVAPIKPGYGPAGVGEVAREGLSNQQIRSAFCPTNPTALCHSRNVSAATGLNLGVLMWSCVMSWNRPFDQPVPLPNGGPARTLRDAANYIKKLPKSERDCPEWRLAIHMLIDAAEDRGPMMLASTGILHAIGRDDRRPRKKTAPAGKD